MVPALVPDRALDGVLAMVPDLMRFLAQDMAGRVLFDLALSMVPNFGSRSDAKFGNS